MTEGKLGQAILFAALYHHSLLCCANANTLAPEAGSLAWERGFFCKELRL